MSAPPEGTRLVVVAENLLETMGTRAADGRLLSFEWGQPDENGWYEPTITATDDHWLETARMAAQHERLVALLFQVRKLSLSEGDVGALQTSAADPDSAVIGWNAAIDTIRDLISDDLIRLAGAA